MSDNILIQEVLDGPTIDLINKLMKMRLKRQRDAEIDLNLVLRYIIQREIQIVKDDYPTKEDLRERNKKRVMQLQDQKVNPGVYCAQFHIDISNIMMCHISCPFGHMLECHYPHDCNSEYCKHYKSQREFEQQTDSNYFNPGDDLVV